MDGERVLVARSADGLRWDPPVEVGRYENLEPGGEYGWPVLRGSGFRVAAMPTLAVDRSDGPHRGVVHVAWFDHAAGGDVVLSASRDGGRAWTAPRRVHDDDPALRADQFLPAIRVGPDGTLDVSWLDRRDDPANRLFHTYHAHSADGGATFSPNLRVSEVASDERHSHHQNGMVFLGDDRDSDSVAGRATLLWTDTRHDKADVRVAHVQRPGATR